MTYNIKSNNIEEINKTRRLSGLEEVNNIARTCLRCGQKFISKGNHNRLCTDCRKINAKE